MTGDEHPGHTPDGDLDCSEVIAEVWTLLDGECTPEIQRRLREHLARCPQCLRRYGVEERIKGLVARSCGGDKAPPMLYQRVRLQISQTTIIHEQIAHEPPAGG